MSRLDRWVTWERQWLRAMFESADPWEEATAFAGMPAWDPAEQETLEAIAELDPRCG